MNHLFLTFALVLFLLAQFSCCRKPDNVPQNTLNAPQKNSTSFDQSWTKVLKITDSFKPGISTRGSIEKYFDHDGGLSFAGKNHIRYCFMECRCIKIDAVFRHVDPNTRVRRIDPNTLNGPDDIVLSVSKPYKEDPSYD